MSREDHRVVPENQRRSPRSFPTLLNLCPLFDPFVMELDVSRITTVNITIVYWKTSGGGGVVERE